MGQCFSKQTTDKFADSPTGGIDAGLDSSIITPLPQGDATNRHLIVDDSDTNRMVIRKYLLRFGHDQIDEACNGKEAIEFIDLNGEYAIIWIDIQMPKMDGIECTKYLRTKMNYKGPIIGVTGHVDNNSRLNCESAGMNSVIAKPMDRKDVLTHIEKYLK